MPSAHKPAATGLLTAEQALALILERAEPVAEVEELELGACLGRVLARAQASPLDVPPADNSAMDGYALRSADLQAEGETRLPVSQRIAAGQLGAPLAPGSAARIFTGAPLPAGADAVVMQERCRTDGSEVVIGGRVDAGENVRRAGEDIRAGSEVLAAGMRLRPQTLGLAASVGLARLPVFRRLRVALFATGDELANPGEPLQPGQIYNSNRYTLLGLAQGLGCEVLDLGTAPDTLAATRGLLERAAQAADVIITSGGVSVGEEDHVKAAVQSLGSLSLWRIAAKPGKPLAFGSVASTPFLGLPGNPVSSFVTFCLFVRPFILRRQGATQVQAAPLSVTAGFDWVRPGDRQEYLRARLELTDTGTGTGTAAIIYPNQSSGVLTSTVWADGLVVIPEATVVRRGETVQYLPFAELLA